MIIAASGYFDPLHIGHLEYLKLAKQLGDKLIVIVNNDKQAKLKKGFSFMNENERLKIVRSLECVDEVFLSIDEDATVCKSLKAIKPNIFAKGGDRYSSEIPEAKICKKLKIKIVDGLGAKIQSSSSLIENAKKNKMKITLISTSTFPSDQGIRTISSVLKKRGYDVKVIFMTLSENYSKNYSKEELVQLLKLCKGSSFIGINSYASTSHRAERIISFLKKNLSIPIIYGGVHATISPQDCIKHADIVCVGEAEEAISDFADAIEKKKSFLKIKNLWIKNKDTGQITKNPVRNLVDDLDSLPLPDYEIKDHFILQNGKITRFKESDLGGQIFFLTGRGCPYGCDYCSNSLLNELYAGKRKKILRWHSPEYIVEGVLYLKKKFPTLGYFDIRDDTFSLRPIEDIKKFCRLYKEKVNMRFKCLGDPHTISEEKIKLLVDAGCTDIIMGIQGSEKTNNEIYHRSQKDEDVLNAARILNKYKNKLAVMYDVITCNPYEKPEHIISLIKLLQKLPKPYYLSVNNLVFFPGSKLDTKARQDGTIKTEKDAAYQLNYWDRSRHIRLKKKNVYLNLILNLMRGSVSENRYGLMPDILLNYLLKEERIRKNLKNPVFSYLVLYFVSLSDLIREKILKGFYRSLPISFKVWYDKIRYRV